MLNLLIEFTPILGYVATSTILLYTALAATAAGSYMSYNASQTAAKNAENAGKYNATVQQNAAINESNAAVENARRKARETARAAAQQRAELAARGLTMEGTPLIVLGDTLTELERDIASASWEASNRAQNLIHGAGMSLWEGQTQASAIRSQANADLVSSVGSMASGYVNSKGLTGSTSGQGTTGQAPSKAYLS